MANAKDIQKRIKSVTSTHKITRTVWGHGLKIQNHMLQICAKVIFTAASSLLY